MIFSCIIPSREQANNPKLADLIQSIKTQTFDQNQIEIIIVTDGTAESAKAIGIRQSKGEILVMLCDDNRIEDPNLFSDVYGIFKGIPGLTGIYSKYYTYKKEDNSLNRYFALIGNNDPIAFYLNKCDRSPHYDYSKEEIMTIMKFEKSVPTLGENGFFFRKEILMKSDLDHYSHIDVTEDLRRIGEFVYARINDDYLWHRTADSLFKLLKKRYIYAKDFYCNSQERRWRMLSNKRDYWRLFVFIASALTIVHPLYTSIRGFIKIRDWAWFWHPVVCVSYLIVYSLLGLRWKLRAL